MHSKSEASDLGLDDHQETREKEASGKAELMLLITAKGSQQDVLSLEQSEYDDVGSIHFSVEPDE